MNQIARHGPSGKLVFLNSCCHLMATVSMRVLWSKQLSELTEDLHKLGTGGYFSLAVQDLVIGNC